MKKLLNIAKTIRNHWKKSTVGFLALSYGVSYGVERYKISQLMRAYCEEAKKYGEQSTKPLKKARHITVILNPVAHKRKAKSLYEKYSSPLLNLAGLKVSLVMTENEGQAKDLMAIMSNTDAVIIAGGNGTLHEAITGLLRRPEFEESNSRMPIGVLPVGNSNYAAKALFAPWSKSEPRWLAEATMAVIKGTTKCIDVIKVEGLEKKPLFAVSSVELGDLTEIETSLPNYWYFGPLKDKLIYLFNSFKSHLVIDDVELEFIPPCEGCSKCHMKIKKSKHSSRWWAVFMPRVKTVEKPEKPTVDYSKVVNEACGKPIKNHSTFSNLIIATSLKYVCSECKPPSKAFWMNIYPANLNLKNYFVLGLAYHKSSNFQGSEIITSISAKEVKLLLPKDSKEKNCFIDTEPYNFKKMTLSLLPKHLVVYG